MLNSKKILIVGGTGSWGQELTKQILEKYKPLEVIIYSRNEFKQVEMKRKFNNNKLNFIIGDIRDKSKLLYITRDVDYIFHLAALKHVPVCENNVDETININIIGTLNLCECAAINNVPNFVLVSTDKAVDPINVYGCSKATAEKIVINYNLKNTNTKYFCIRAGNVFGTSGSVFPLFKKQLSENNMLTITDENMTRYIFKLKDAINLIFEAIHNSDKGEIFITKMPSIKITDLAKVMINLYGNKKSKIKNIGIRPGEKIHEALISKNEACRTIEFNKNYFIVLPMFNVSDKWKNYKILNKEYSSLDNKFLSLKEIKKLILSESNHIDFSEFDIYKKDEILSYFKREGWIS